MQERNAMLQDDLTSSGEDAARTLRAIHWAFIVMWIGLGIILFLLAALVFVYMRAG